MNIEKEQVSRKSAALTATLGLLFGMLGAHRFYVGKHFSGIVYFIFGSSTIAIQILSRIDVVKGTLIGIFLNILVYIAILYDIFALYKGSFLDSKGKVILSGSQQDEFVGRTIEEKSDDTDGILFSIVSIVVFVVSLVVLSSIT